MKNSACRLALAAAMLIASSTASSQQAIPDTIAQRVLACSACHGKEGRATSEGYFPRIAGKPAGYLHNQLLNFRSGRRKNQMMAYMTAHLSDAYLLEIANHFSSLHFPYPPPQAIQVSQAVMDRGKQLAMSGDPSLKVPACSACHGKNLTGVAPATPGLLGLPRDYLNAQFGAWRGGTRKAAAPDCMAQIASGLSSDDISAVTAWLASQAVSGDGAPAIPLAAKLPLPCGSVPQ